MRQCDISPDAQVILEHPHWLNLHDAPSRNLLFQHVEHCAERECLACNCRATGHFNSHLRPKHMNLLRLLASHMRYVAM